MSDPSEQAWRNIARADFIDKQSRLLFVKREAPDAPPYLNLYSPWIKPSADDIAAATAAYDRA